MSQEEFHIRSTTAADVAVILRFIRELAAYEKLSHEVTATEESLRKHLFGERPGAEAILAVADGEEAGFALYFHNFSSFLGRPGIYLEDLYVRPEFRGRGMGKALMVYLARLARQRDCGRFEWAVLDWNKPSLDFYQFIGARPMSEWVLQRMTGEALAALAEGTLPWER